MSALSYPISLHGSAHYSSEFLHVYLSGTLWCAAYHLQLPKLKKQLQYTIDHKMCWKVIFLYLNLFSPKLSFYFLKLDNWIFFKRLVSLPSASKVNICPLIVIILFSVATCTSNDCLILVLHSISSWFHQVLCRNGCVKCSHLLKITYALLLYIPCQLHDIT